MPAVVTYWGLPDDELEFLAYLHKTGSIVAVSDGTSDTREALLREPIVRFLEHCDPVGLWFGREQDLSANSIEAAFVNGKTVYALPYMRPNVIGYKRAKIYNGKLSRYNLFVYWTYPNDEATRLIRKDESFVKWAKAVLAWARRATPERIFLNGYPYRATRRAKAAVDAGEIEVML